ncbi:MAG TPA: 50S ribosomal protein L22 [Pyrinomonadaceae bacterium]|nr:50S ribosomal protein L22 [Pyrinomonadaceae bacterium]
MEAIAKTKYLKGSPRKARLVIDLIRGRNVSQALAILKFTDKRAADPIAKTLRSAIANATYLAEQQNIAIDPDDLWVKTCFVDMGPTKNRRRMRPAPQGRAYREQRHYCHITIQVTSEAQEDKAKKAKPETEVKKAKPAKAEKKAEPKAKKETKVVEETVVEETKPIETTEAVEAQEVKNEAEVADAKDATSQTPAEKNETKPADEAQADTNEELEKQ